MSAKDWRAHRLAILLPAISGCGLALGLILGWMGRGDWGAWFFATATVPVLLSLIVEITRSLERGTFLESIADRWVAREITALLARVPRSALRLRNSHLEEVTLEVRAR